MRFLLLTIAMLLIVAPVMAANYYEGFEGMTAGDLATQTGWVSNGAYDVVTGSALNGTNAIAAVGPDDLRTTYATAPTFQDGTVVSIDARHAVGGYFTWNVNDGTNNVPFAGLASYNGVLLVADGGYGWYFDTSKAMYADHNYALSATLNFTDETVHYNVADLTDATNYGFDYWFASETTGAEAAAGGFYLSGPGGMYDNLAVTSSVPEPSALVAFGTGLMGMLGFVIRRRK